MAEAITLIEGVVGVLLALFIAVEGTLKRTLRLHHLLIDLIDAHYKLRTQFLVSRANYVKMKRLSALQHPRNDRDDRRDRSCDAARETDHPPAPGL